MPIPMYSYEKDKGDIGTCGNEFVCKMNENENEN